ncbi:MAG: aspartyl/asparaginyl beta-hydroxylase domain-containing protein [Tsuneonella sp.]
MDIGQPLIDYGPVDCAELRDALELAPAGFWDVDTASRTRVAGSRPGRAVFFYNDKPAGVVRNSIAEVQTGQVSVLVYPDRPLFRQITRLIDTAVRPHFPECNPVRVQLAELPPGSVIAPHTDRNLLTMMHRLHVPLVTDDNVRFTIDRQIHVLKIGRLYELNNAVVHAVENSGAVNRIHLLIDMLPYAVARARYFDALEAMVDALH